MIRFVEPKGRGFREYGPPIRTYREFKTRFPDETACRDFLFAQHFPDGFTCRKCGTTAFRWLDSKRLRCRQSRCLTKFSLTAGTILHGCRKPLRLWFKAAFYVVQLGTNATMLKELLELTYKIAWTWCHKLRRVMSSKTTLDAAFPPLDRAKRERRGFRVHGVAERVHFGFNGNFRWRISRPGGLGTCCQRLMKPDWDEPDEITEPRRFAMWHSTPKPGYPYEWLFRDYSGSFSDKHARAYFDETEFRVNHRRVPPFETASKLIARFVETKPHPYRAITGIPPSREALRHECFTGPNPLAR